MSVWIVSILLLIETFTIGVGLVAIALNRFPCLLGELSTVASCILLGGLGGCSYCLRGVYLNACVRKSWDTAWLPWYALRPFVSLIFGGISYLFVKSGLLLLGAEEQPEASQLGIWAIAFLAGLNVDKFVAKIEAIGQTVWGLEPSRQSKASLDQGNSGSETK